jgi:hypothetical protein
MTNFLNLVRKNVTILLRNANTRINVLLTGGEYQSFNKSMIFRLVDNPTGNILDFSDIKLTFQNDLDRSLIVIGADINIDEDVTTPPGLTQPRVFIALRNEKGE